MDKLRVLLVGESWMTHTLHVKGMDTFTQSGYGEGIRWFKRAVESIGSEFVHMPAHTALTEFPFSPEELSPYDVVVLSDVGSKTLLLHPDTSVHSIAVANRLKVIEDYVIDGGGLLMIGGYMSFQGIEGKAAFRATPVERVLPVWMMANDDRVEVPEGFNPRSTAIEHPTLANLPETFPTMLFRNHVTLKDGADLLLEHDGEVVLASWAVGAGRSAAFTPDIAPHGATPEFLEWEFFDRFISQLVVWLSGR